MSTGTVKWFDVKKGFGFVVNAEGQDVFVHFSSIEGEGFRTLKEGERVEYEQSSGDKGLLARNVRRIEARRSRPGRDEAVDSGVPAGADGVGDGGAGEATAPLASG